jgi:hypothetical protein
MTIIMTIAMTSIVRCEVFCLNEGFQGIYFGHAFSKRCQYTTISEKACKNFIVVSIKFAQLDL